MARPSLPMRRRRAWRQWAGAGLIALAGQATAQVTVPPGANNLPDVAARRDSGPGLRLQAGVDTRLVTTSNAGPDAQGNVRSDSVLEVQPWVSARVAGPRLRLNGEVQLGVLDYLGGTGPTRVLPRVRTDAEAELLDQWFYLLASYRYDPTFEDPFAARADQSVNYKLEPRQRAVLTPELRRRLSAQSSLLVRSEHAITRVDRANDAGRIETQGRDSRLLYTHDARPFGGDVELRDNQTWSGEPSTRVYLSRMARLVGAYAPTPQLTLGLMLGHEQVELLGTGVANDLRGLRLRWVPDRQTSVNVEFERRFFGNAWDIAATRSTSLTYAALRLQRAPSTERSQGATIGVGQDVAAVLDAMLISQIPDATERSAEIGRIMTARGLPATATEAIDVLTTLPELRQGGSVLLGLRGARNFVFVTASTLRLSPLDTGDLLLLPLLGIESSQRVYSLGWSLRTGPRTAATLVAEAYRTEGRQAREGDYTHQRIVRAEVSRLLSPGSSATLGLRRLIVRSNVLTRADTAGESALYVGLRHRF